MKKILILSLLLVAALVVIDNQHSTIVSLKEQAVRQKENTQQTAQDSELAIKLVEGGTWHVIDSHTISSGPVGTGKILNLSEPLRPQGNRMGIKHPGEKNLKVQFSPTTAKGIAYSVAGGLIAYDYL